MPFFLYMKLVDTGRNRRHWRLKHYKITVTLCPNQSDLEQANTYSDPPPSTNAPDSNRCVCGRRVYVGEPFYFCPCGVKVGTVCSLFPFRPLSIRGTTSDKALKATLCAYGERFYNEEFKNATASSSTESRSLPTVVEVGDSSGGEQPSLRL